ncbi:MAG: hypothetical protein GX275_05945 [Clostridiales bacterium]|nr:hypothetical protein [Clostridiales bacterium]
MKRTSKMSIIKEFLDNIEIEDKNEIIKELTEKFKIKKNTAERYYYLLRCEENESKQEIMEERYILDIGVNREKIRIRDYEKDDDIRHGEYIDYRVIEGGIEVNGNIFKSEKDIEDFRRREFKVAYSQLGEVFNVLKAVKKGELV